MKNSSTWFYELYALLFPRVCQACGNRLYRSEEVICLSCLYKLPKTGFHEIPGNPVEKIFWGRVPLQRATAMLFFSKGSRVQTMLHRLKYDGRREVGVKLGELYGQELIHSDFLKGIDHIVAVPIHPKKERIRGYNQTDLIAQGLSAETGIPIQIGLLERMVHSESQTKAKRHERFDKVEHVFKLNPIIELENKHILLIDDVVTTGATIEACSQLLIKGGLKKLSVATVSFADAS